MTFAIFDRSCSIMFYHFDILIIIFDHVRRSNPWAESRAGRAGRTARAGCAGCAVHQHCDQGNKSKQTMWRWAIFVRVILYIGLLIEKSKPWWVVCLAHPPGQLLFIHHLRSAKIMPSSDHFGQIFSIFSSISEEFSHPTSSKPQHREFEDVPMIFLYVSPLFPNCPIVSFGLSQPLSHQSSGDCLQDNLQWQKIPCLNPISHLWEHMWSMIQYIYIY